MTIAELESLGEFANVNLYTAVSSQWRLPTGVDRANQ